MPEESLSPRVGHARKLARNLIAELNINQPPILLDDVIKRVRKHHDLSVFPWELGTQTDGIQISGENMSAIGYNQSQHRHRQRFTVAHELGHFLLGHTSKERPLDLESKVPDEVEANQFAAELLMPLALLKSDINGGQKQPKMLAKKYDVSEEAIWWRLLECRLIEKI
ncbi:MAG: ImmA/IrrE family metallo-endopeptidase [Actinobacteria bacterium]|nr:MAG: ImmA/IrrE family metallo-endopeptidase [Actinomycetota bacterium]